MKWYWKVRIYRPDGHYGVGQVETSRNLTHIDTIQNFYLALTGCKMILEAMSENPFVGFSSIHHIFKTLYEDK